MDLLDNYTYISSNETGIHCFSGGLCDYSILIYTAITAFSLSTKFLLRFPDLLKPYLIVKRLPELDYDSRQGFERFSLCIVQILLLRSVILERCEISDVEVRPQQRYVSDATYQEFVRYRWERNENSYGVQTSFPMD